MNCRCTAPNATSVCSPQEDYCPSVSMCARPFRLVGQLMTQGLLVIKGPRLWRPALGGGRWQPLNTRTPSRRGCPRWCPMEDREGLSSFFIGGRLVPSAAIPTGRPTPSQRLTEQHIYLGSFPAFQLRCGSFCHLLCGVSLWSYCGGLCSPHLDVARPNRWHLRLKEAFQIS